MVAFVLLIVSIRFQTNRYLRLQLTCLFSQLPLPSHWRKSLFLFISRSPLVSCSKRTRNKLRHRLIHGCVWFEHRYPRSNTVSRSLLCKWTRSVQKSVKAMFTHISPPCTAASLFFSSVGVCLWSKRPPCRHLPCHLCSRCCQPTSEHLGHREHGSSSSWSSSRRSESPNGQLFCCPKVLRPTKHVSMDKM